MKLANLSAPISWSELAKRTYNEAMEDDSLGLAAQLAYYFFLALFPALLFLLALASFFPIAEATERLPEALGRFAAPEMVTLLREQIQQISSSSNGGILSIGLLGALWSSSAALVSIASALNRAYDIEESRPWWKVRLIAIALTVTLAVFVLAAFTLVLAGPTLAEAAARVFGFGEAFRWAWLILQWPVAFVLICVAVGVVYYFAPDADQEWVWVTPGAVLATALWLLASLLFRFYAVSFGDYQATYGALGGVVVLMLWMYMTGLAIVIGAGRKGSRSAAQDRPGCGTRVAGSAGPPTQTRPAAGTGARLRADGGPGEAIVRRLGRRVRAAIDRASPPASGARVRAFYFFLGASQRKLAASSMLPLPV